MNAKTKTTWMCGVLIMALLACDEDTTDPSDGGGSLDGGSDGGGDGGDNNGGEDGGMPRGPMGAPTLGVQIDRMGRPAINTALNATFESDMAKKDAAKDAYNASAADKFSSFKEEFEANLAVLDGLDGTCGNQLLAGATATADRYATLAGVLADDRIFVNTAVGECGVYLGVEAEAISAVTAGAGKCGGRTPLDDVIERSYSLLAAGILSGVDDGVAKDDVDHDLDTFPFLHAPQK